MGTMMTTCCADDSPDYDRARNTPNVDEIPLIEEPKDLDEMANDKDEMVNNKVDYYQKCVDLTKNMSLSINTPTIIEHDKETHTNNWNYINSIAQVCEESLNDLAKKLVLGVKAFPNNNNYDSIKIIKAIKDEQSAKEECEKLYNGNWFRVVDTCKETIICNDFKQIYFMLLMLAKYNQNCCGFEIISIKKTNKKNISILVLPVQYSVNDEDVNANDYKKKVIAIDMKCTEEERNILESLKMNMADNDEDEQDDEEEFLNLPAHVCEIEFIHKYV